ncbi:glycosyltransferase family 4 protein [Olsenella profusa]|uniref:Glycosyltransferase family 4 protein n=1 Tax=Olsenella profusa TaxID=138595 RepID=A0ABS2F279_9ACTN|nr:glycosyltransferase family 4 protein [Olsenella profusa]MBM6774925.1 glycosyltransferase family 4 protein [Olsenella profusa]
MRVLVVCQHYWPEPFNTSEVCEELARRGHGVTVITALPNTGMPDNDIPRDWRDPARWDQLINGVRVLRVKLHPRLSGAKNRVLNYLSFWYNANKLAGKLKDDFDVVLGYQFSPVMQVDPGLVYARQHHKKMLLYCFDLWPVSLTAGGFSDDSLPYKWMTAVSKRIYRQADRIAVTSPLFDEYFRNELGIVREDSAYLPQFAEDSFSTTEGLPVPEGYDPSKINLTFAGNVGQAQSVITIVEAAALLVDEPEVAFHVVGSGSQLASCEARADELGVRSVTFHGRRPLEDMPAYYSASDAMLVTFEDSPMATYTLPRKATTYLAAGKPILAALSGETKRVIDEAGCGLTCGTADAWGLAEIVRQFAALPVDSRERMGAASRSYYQKRFTKERFFERLESLLSQLAEVN